MEIEGYREEWFEKLLTCVEADTLTQDSICCVNTSLLILIFAEQEKTLEKTIKKYQNKEFKN